MEELATTYKDKLNIVSISTDNKNAWEIASEKHHMSWNNCNDLKGKAEFMFSMTSTAFPTIRLSRPKALSLNNGPVTTKVA